MKRYDHTTRGCGSEVYSDMYETTGGQYLKRDEVIDAVESCSHSLYEGLDFILDALGISKDEYQAAEDRNHPGPEPDYDGSSVLDYSRGVR